MLLAQPAANLRQQQEAAAAKQREAARAQAGVSGKTDSFFTVPFDAPPTLPSNPNCAPADRKKVDDLLAKAAQRESLSRDVLNAVVETESGFDSCAISDKGAQGLMQLMPEVQKEFGVDDPFDAEKNIAAGASLLKRLLAEHKGDLKLALAAYNAGSARVAEAKGVPPIAETRDYVEKILNKVQKPEGKPPP